MIILWSSISHGVILAQDEILNSPFQIWSNTERPPRDFLSAEMSKDVLIDYFREESLEWIIRKRRVDVRDICDTIYESLWPSVGSLFSRDKQTMVLGLPVLYSNIPLNWATWNWKKVLSFSASASRLGCWHFWHSLKLKLRRELLNYLPFTQLFRDRDLKLIKIRDDCNTASAMFEWNRGNCITGRRLVPIHIIWDAI